MWRRPYRLYLSLAVALLIVMSFSQKTTNSLRGSMIASFSPLWTKLSSLRIRLLSNSQNGSSILPLPKKEGAQIEVENEILKQKIRYLEDILEQEYALEADLMEGQRLLQLSSNKNSFFLRRYEELAELVELKAQALPAQVLYRTLSSWNSSLWINVGTQDNERLGRLVVAKNSPVIAGLSVIGVVDYAGKQQSRVRLITDSGLSISVRAARGYLQNRSINHHLEALLTHLNQRNDLFNREKDLDTLIQNLQILKRNLSEKQEGWLLAKGELHGSGLPLWRSSGSILIGAGFNYDYQDEEGAARDLRTGAIANPGDDPLPILKVGDLLVTTGMDGLFPAGLHVAEVTRIGLLKEGSYTYDLEAVPTAGSFDLMTTFFILPPTYFDPDDQPD